MSTTPTAPLTSSGGSSSPNNSHHHHRGHRLRQFLSPEGREVHIALSPEEAETLRRDLAAIRKDQAFDLVINGSPEHLEHLRRAHSHHESRREALRAKHGEAYDEFENVRTELDVLSSELHMLTDHAVSLDANFSKYGYSAHLRTYDDTSGGSSGKSSRAASIQGFHDDDHEVKKDWEAERKNGTVMKLYKKPTVRQYHHKGLIWRASDTTEVQSFELFVDLLYVGILAVNGDHAAEDPTGYELLRFSITFIMSWKIWSDLTLIISWFETDDIAQRISVMFIMGCLLGLTTNMLDAFESTYSMLVSFYLAARLFMAAYLLVLAGVIPIIRGTMITQVILVAIPSVIWIGSIYVEMPNRLALIWITLFLDLTAPMFFHIFTRFAARMDARLGRWVGKVFDFVPATNIEHKVERTNAFVTLVFGYSVVAIIYQNAASFGLNAFFGKAVLGLVQAFCFNWIYFELDGADLHKHAIRRHVLAAMAWNTIHIPFVMSFVMAGAALSKVVLATDCRNTNIDFLTPAYMLKSEPQIPSGLRWFYCCGLGIALACMGIIHLTHVHKEAPKGVRIPLKLRMLNRFAVCIILICLALLDFNSLHLVATTTCLIIWVLTLELYGNTCPETDTWFGDRKDKKPCRYTARCSKRALERALKNGSRVNVEELGEKDSLKNSFGVP